MEESTKKILVRILAGIWRLYSWGWVLLVIAFLTNFAASILVGESNNDYLRLLPRLLSEILSHPLGSILTIVLVLFFALSSYVAHVYQVKETLKESPKILPYNQRMKQLTEQLTIASESTDGILKEMAQIIKDREEAVNALELKQTQLKRYIDSLQQGPAEPLKIFEEILKEQARQQDKDGRKLARRYFIYGSIVTLVGTGMGILFTFPSLFGK